MRIFILLTTMLWATQIHAVPLTPEQVPAPLKPWTQWILQQHPELKCPVQYNQQTRDCVWPGELSFIAHTKGASFSQSMTVYQKSRVKIPGDKDYWPTSVIVNGKSASVIEHQRSPAILLQPGQYKIQGQFQWTRLPDAISINPQTGIIHYRLKDKAVKHPQIRQGKLWLQSGQQRTTEKAPEDRLTVEVYRLLSDGHPFQVTTQLSIEVSGAQREVLLGKPLLAGFIPLQLDSVLPARIEPDGQIRVQVRPGRWQLQLTARAPDTLTALAMPNQQTPWPSQEIWVYRAARQDRLTEIENVTQIDPRQVRLPSGWSNLPAYRITPQDAFTIKVIRRGDPDSEPDQLTLNRDLWLDFDGNGYTLRDQISGKMTSDWRLSVDPEIALGRVTINGAPQFITRLEKDKRQGVEVRRGQLNLVAESRYEGGTNKIPASGWGRDLQQLKTTLHLPPGWQLFTVTGVDNVPTSWVQRWTLYDLFIVLITTIAAGKLWGWKWSPLALVGLSIIWHEPNAPRMIWLYLLASIALLRVAPSDGRFYRLIRMGHRAGLLTLLVIALPFMVQQARTGLYPQLELPQVTPHSMKPAGTLNNIFNEALESADRAEKHAVGGMGDAELYPELDAEPGKYIVPPVVDRPLSSVVTKKFKAPLNQIDPNATIQTGPGLPNWKWKTAQLNWSGPVAADQQVNLYLVGPGVHLILNFLMIGFVVALAWRFIDHQRGNGPRRKLAELLVVPLAFIALLGLPYDTMAQDFPSNELLQQLEKRLIENPVKAPRASITSMSLQVRGDSYQSTLEIHALQDTAIPLPIDSKQVTPVRVQVDGKNIGAKLYRKQNNQLWVVVPSGQHTIILNALLPVAEQLQIPLPLKPHRVTLDVKGWSVEGINKEGVPDSQLSFTRIRSAAIENTIEDLTPTALPPFLRVERTLSFGINWEIVTRVTRHSPTGSPLSMKIPVISGASVVSDGFRVKNGRVLVNMAASQREIVWRSRLDPVDELTLMAPDNNGWLETWRANIGPIWHVSIEGIPPVHHQNANNNWLPEWHPWPGEQVVFKVVRPTGVAGNTMTVDNTSLTVRPGTRATDSTLTFMLRASQGGQYELQLPEAVQLRSTKINNVPQPIRQEGRKVSLPVIPGQQSFELVWRDTSGISGAWQTPQFSLMGESVNARITVMLPRDRWTLWVNGPDLGPAVLFWGVLFVLLLVSAALTKVSASYLPLGFASWLLLGVGLSQVSTLSGIVVVGWFFLLHYRGQLSEEIKRWKFNLLQIGLGLLTLVSLGILLWVVQQGLLGLPEMQIRGYGSNAYTMYWYQDSVEGVYPQAFILSTPVIVYRLLMLAWALWLAFTLLKWLKWGWAAFSVNGLWRGKIVTDASISKEVAQPKDS